MLFLSGDKLVADRNKIQRQRRRNRALVAIARANQKMSVRLAAVILSSSTLVSALLGIYRDRLLNSMYLDTYKLIGERHGRIFQLGDVVQARLESADITTRRLVFSLA